MFSADFLNNLLCSILVFPMLTAYTAPNTHLFHFQKLCERYKLLSLGVFLRSCQLQSLQRVYHFLLDREEQEDSSAGLASYVFCREGQQCVKADKQIFRVTITSRISNKISPVLQRMLKNLPSRPNALSVYIYIYIYMRNTLLLTVGNSSPEIV